MAVKKEPNIKSAKFPLEKLLKAAVFSNRKDALGVVIHDGEEVTIEEAQSRLNKFMKERVN